MSKISPTTKMGRKGGGEWSSRIVTCESVDTARLVVSLDCLFPAAQDRRRPLLIEDHGKFDGLWIIKRYLEAGKKLELVNPAKLPHLWTVQRTTKGLVICPPSEATKCPSNIGVIGFAPPLVFLARSTILSITAVDTIAQCFEADIQCELSLRAISQIDSREIIDDFLSVYQVSIGVLQVMNGGGDREVWTSTRLAFDNDSLFDYSFKLRAKGSFGEEFELQTFPFDEQCLSVCLSLLQSHEWVSIAENTEFPATFVHTNFQLGNIYRVLLGDVVLVDTSFSSPQESASGLIYPRVAFRIRLGRRSTYYTTNVALPMMVVCYLSFLSFAQTAAGEKLELPDRLSITLTLLLTAVAYKFVVASLLPQVAYLTLLDLYVSVCFVCMCLVALLNSLFPYLEAAHGLHGAVEYYAVAALLGVFSLLNVSWAVHTWRWLNVRERETRRLLLTEHAKKALAALFGTAPLAQRMVVVRETLQLLGLPLPPSPSPSPLPADGADQPSELLEQLQVPALRRELAEQVARQITAS